MVEKCVDEAESMLPVATQSLSSLIGVWKRCGTTLPWRSMACQIFIAQKCPVIDCHFLSQLDLRPLAMVTKWVDNV